MLSVRPLQLKKLGRREARNDHRSNQESCTASRVAVWIGRLWRQRRAGGQAMDGGRQTANQSIHYQIVGAKKIHAIYL